MRLVPLMFVVSGATGLIYEVLWTRYLGLALGHSATAQAVVLASFLGGLALGGAWLGPWGDRAASPVRLYGWLELAITLYAAASPWLLHGIELGYVAVARSSGLDAGALLAWRMAAAILALAPPAVLMGGTLPALARHRPDAGRSLATLYSCNTLGAVAGCLLAAYVLIPGLGLSGGLAATVAVNGGLAIAALLTGRPAPPAPPQAGAAPMPPWILPAVFASGFGALVLEVAWVRLNALVLGTSTYAFALMAAAFIAGVAAGSLVLRLPAVAALDPRRLFGLSQGLLALLLALSVPGYRLLPYAFVRVEGWLPVSDAGFWWFQGLQAAVALAIALPPAACLGVALPSAARAALTNPRTTAASVGRVFGVNALGNVLGALAAGQLCLPYLGLPATLFAVAGLAALLAAIALPAARILAFAAVAGIWLLAAALPPDPLAYASDVARSAAEDSFTKYRGELARVRPLYRHDGPEATVAVTMEDNQTLMLINGRINASAIADMPSQILLGQLPFLLAPHARRALIVGLGCGVTAGAALTHPLDAVDVVELDPGVVDAARRFAAENRHALDDPRCHIHVEDALGYLRVHPGRYDVIASEPCHLWTAGVGDLLATEFYRLARERLAPGGLFVQWVQTYDMSDEAIAVAVRTLRTAFPRVAAWQGVRGDLILVAGDEGAIDVPALAERMARPAVRADLARIGITRPATLLATQLQTARRVARLVPAEGLTNRWDRPWLEYQVPRMQFLEQSSNLFSLWDQRLGWPPRPGGESDLERYLDRRGHALDPDEYREIVAYQDAVMGQHELAWSLAEAWEARFPGDERARWARAQALLAGGKTDRAGRVLGAIAAAHPRDPAVRARLEALEARYATRKDVSRTSRRHLARELERALGAP